MSFYFLYRSIVINVVVLNSIVYRLCSKEFLCIRFDEIRLRISYEFYMKDILKTYRMSMKNFISALLFICLYAMNDIERLVQDLREVKYAGP